MLFSAPGTDAWDFIRCALPEKVVLETRDSADLGGGGRMEVVFGVNGWKELWRVWGQVGFGWCEGRWGILREKYQKLSH